MKLRGSEKFSPMIFLLLRPNSVIRAWTLSHSRINTMRTAVRLGTLSDEEYQVEPPAASTVPRKFVPFPFPYHHIIEARVESLTNLGVGICRVPLPLDTITQDDSTNSDETSLHLDHSINKGWVVMVPNVIPGELIQCRVFRNHGKYSEADLMQVIEKHPKVGEHKNYA
jgi:hypothetical protein